MVREMSTWFCMRARCIQKNHEGAREKGGYLSPFLSIYPLSEPHFLFITYDIWRWCESDTITKKERRKRRRRRQRSWPWRDRESQTIVYVLTQNQYQQPAGVTSNSAVQCDAPSQTYCHQKASVSNNNQRCRPCFASDGVDSFHSSVHFIRDTFKTWQQHSCMHLCVT